MARRAWLLPPLLTLALVASRVSAQEVLEDQDPIDPDWAPAWDTPFWPAPRGASLELAAGRRGNHTPVPLDGLGRSVAGDYVLALLTLPLAAGPRTSPAAEPGDGAEQGEPSAADEPSSSPAVPPAREGPSVPAPPNPRAASPEPFEAEPGEELPLSLVQDAVDRADQAGGFKKSLRRLGSIGQRARWSGLAPELRLRGATGIDQTRSVDSAGLVPSDETLRDGSDSLVEVRLTFHLERLLHGAQEVALERARQQLLLDRAEVHRQVTKELVVYVRARGRLDAHVDDAALEDGERERLTLLAEQARLSLYLLTGGWFRGEQTLRRYEAPSPKAASRGTSD